MKLYDFRHTGGSCLATGGGDDHDFRSPSELSEILERLGLNLHAKNRIAEGECDLLWFLAETIRKAGRVAELAAEADHYDDILHGFEVSDNITADPDVMRFLALLAAQPTR